MLTAEENLLGVLSKCEYCGCEDQGEEVVVAGKDS